MRLPKVTTFPVIVFLLFVASNYLIREVLPSSNNKDLLTIAKMNFTAPKAGEGENMLNITLEASKIISEGLFD